MGRYGRVEACRQSAHGRIRYRVPRPEGILLRRPNPDDLARWLAILERETLTFDGLGQFLRALAVRIVYVKSIWARRSCCTCEGSMPRVVVTHVLCEHER